MSKNDIIFGNEARTKAQKGIERIAKAVKQTIGPKGRNVLFKQEGSANSTVTNDGVTIIRQADFKDKMENIGLSLVKEVAEQTNEEAGDGTTYLVAEKGRGPDGGSGQKQGSQDKETDKNLFLNAFGGSGKAVDETR